MISVVPVAFILSNTLKMAREVTETCQCRELKSYITSVGLCVNDRFILMHCVESMELNMVVRTGCRFLHGFSTAWARRIKCCLVQMCIEIMGYFEKRNE